jgi:Aldo/keto reductase family
MPLRPLGRSGVHVPALGVGTNRWGRGRGADQLAPVFSAALDTGANLFDTAEIYLGSEQTIGACLRRDPRPALVVTKFAPYPTRLSARSFHKALEGSLARLGVDAVDLYLTHFPFLRGGNPVRRVRDVRADDEPRQHPRGAVARMAERVGRRAGLLHRRWLPAPRLPDRRIAVAALAGGRHRWRDGNRARVGPECPGTVLAGLESPRCPSHGPLADRRRRPGSTRAATILASRGARADGSNAPQPEI